MGKKGSNKGHRRLKLDERILLFLIRLRQRHAYEGLGILFGVSETSVATYYKEMLLLFHTDVVPRLLRPLTARELDAVTPQTTKDQLPGAFIIWDATGLPVNSKENVCLSRLLYSAYHHKSELFATFGMRGMCVGGFVNNLTSSRLRDEWNVGFSNRTLWRP